MAAGEVELIHRRVPHPERRLAPARLGDRLAADDRPAILAIEAMPATAAGLDQGVPAAGGFAIPEQRDGRAGRAAGRLLEQLLPTRGIGHEGVRIAPQRLLFEHWPTGQLLDPSSVAPGAAGAPGLAVERHLAGGKKQQPGQQLLLPGLAALGAPAFPLQRRRHPLFGLSIVAPALEIEAAGRRRQHLERIGQRGEKTGLVHLGFSR
jgi:hypothetical protein